MIKYFRLDYDYILWGISYTNYVMLQATIPVYNSDEKAEEKKETAHEGLESIADFLNLK